MRKNKKIPWKTICFILLAALAGAALGYWGMSQVDGLGIPGLLALLLLLVLAYILQVAVHEGGHLVCGLLTGYRPLFYRLGRIMLVKREGRWRLCRYHIPGTGGQCLMLPPERETVPYRLYNWGGGLANLLLAVLAMPAVLLGSSPLLRVFAMALALIGIWMAGTNLIPMQIGGIANDGYNARNLGKDQAALRGYVFQLRANAALLEGRSLSDLPESWFQVPDGADRGNPFVAGIAMQAAARKLELGAVEEADREFRSLLDREDLLGLYRLEITSEVIFCGLLLGRSRGELEALSTPELEKYRKATRPYFLSRSRQDYAWALLAEGDRDAAARALERFERVAADSPYPGELAGERRLLELVRRTAGQREMEEGET